MFQVLSLCPKPKKDFPGPSPTPCFTLLVSTSLTVLSLCGHSLWHPFCFSFCLSTTQVSFLPSPLSHAPSRALASTCPPHTDESWPTPAQKHCYIPVGQRRKLRHSGQPPVRTGPGHLDTKAHVQTMNFVLRLLMDTFSMFYIKIFPKKNCNFPIVVSRNITKPTFKDICFKFNLPKKRGTSLIFPPSP